MKWNRRRLVFRGWIAGMLLCGAALLYLTLREDFSLAERIRGTAWLPLGLLAVAFLAEYVDSTLGMGYGTVLTPVLMIVGFPAIQVVPAVLLSEAVTGVFAGTMHHRAGNVDFGKDTEARRVVVLLVACSIAGTAVAVFLAVSIPKDLVSAYISLMLIGIGVFVLYGKRFLGGFSMRKIAGLGVVAAFNKGISGGGFGPLMTGGQVLLGVAEKPAIGITSLTEGLVCMVGLGIYCAAQGWPVWSLALPMTVGGVLSVPASAWTVRVLPAQALRNSIGGATVFLGSLSLAKLVMSFF